MTGVPEVIQQLAKAVLKDETVSIMLHDALLDYGYEELAQHIKSYHSFICFGYCKCISSLAEGRFTSVRGWWLLKELKELESMLGECRE